MGAIPAWTDQPDTAPGDDPLPPPPPHSKEPWLRPPWDARSWVENDAWGWESAVTDDPEQLYAQWYAAAKRSQVTWAQLCADGGLDVVIDTGEPAWAKTRRRFLIDLLEEYLKHTGHADLLREAIDGLRGNDPR